LDGHDQDVIDGSYAVVAAESLEWQDEVRQYNVEQVSEREAVKAHKELDQVENLR
jgi:hypothetical protein